MPEELRPREGSSRAQLPSPLDTTDAIIDNGVPDPMVEGSPVDDKAGPQDSNRGIGAHTPSERLVRIGGLDIAFNHPHDLLGILEVFVLDIYSLSRIQRGTVVLDVGAGVGDFAIAAARRVGPEGLVVAIEAGADDFATLEENLRRNRTRNVMAYNLAAGEAAGSVDLLFKGSRFTAQSVALADLLAKLRVGTPRWPPLDFVKIDVEGLEGQTIRGIGTELQSVKVLAIELHGTKPEVDRLLLPEGFSFQPLTRRRYLINCLKFAAFHPVQALLLWRELYSAKVGPKVGKVIRGLDIVRGRELLVGIYTRGV